MTFFGRYVGKAACALKFCSTHMNSRNAALGLFAAEMKRRLARIPFGSQNSVSTVPVAALLPHMQHPLTARCAVNAHSSTFDAANRNSYCTYRIVPSSAHCWAGVGSNSRRSDELEGSSAI